MNKKKIIFGIFLILLGILLFCCARRIATFKPHIEYYDDAATVEY